MTVLGLAKLDQLKNALQSLKSVLIEYEQNPSLGVRDGAIQRFEFTCELVWKVLKERIEESGREEHNNPKNIFRVASDIGLIDNPETWFGFLKNRNLSSHLYDDGEMTKIFSDISAFIVETEKIVVALDRES